MVLTVVSKVRPKHITAFRFIVTGIRSMEKKLYVICHNVRSRENIGSIFRTADAFGVDKVFLTGYTPSPPHPKISKTALGAEEWVLWEKVFSPTRLIKKLKKESFFIAALEQHPNSFSIGEFKNLKVKKSVVLVLGNEVIGILPRILKQCDAVFEILQRGKKESINVAVAFGIAAFLLTR